MAFRSSFRDIVLPIPSVWMHDAWIALIIGGASRLAMIPKPLVSYRQHGSNQVGVRRSNKNKNKDFHEIYENKILCFELIRARLLELADQFPNIEQQIFRFDEKLIFLRARAEFPSSRWRRGPCVMRELVLLRYHRYSIGWENAFDDMTRSNKRIHTAHGSED